METKDYIALARASSREQERERYSLDVQVEALIRYATQHGGEISKMWRIAETASKTDERRTFKELVVYAKRHAAELDGLLFYKVDRAARNLFDYVELERLESEHNLPFISISQPTENTPAGHMQRRILASMASFYTEQQSVDVREGMSRRVQEGWFPCTPPYGYRAVRPNGRSVVEVHPDNAKVVARIFRLYAYDELTVEGLIEKMVEMGLVYTQARPRFCRSKVHVILRDRSYIGEVKHHGQWHPGKHQPLVDRLLWDRVQARLGGKVMLAHELTFASCLIVCGHCRRFITGEAVKKKATNKEYRYYRCCGYTQPGHPRVRLTEAELDQQFLDLFGRLKVEDAQVRSWFVEILQARTKEKQ